MYSNTTVNEQQVISFLKDAVKRVEGSSDADILAFKQIKKLYKQNVPFTRRNYVAAWLVKQALSASAHSRYGKDRGERSERFSRERSTKFERAPSSSFSQRQDSAPRSEESRSERQERAPRVQIDSSLATTIFVGIGRNRRVFPRDLVGLLVSVAGLERERIGDIRVLANYSFIQLFSDDCEKVINALNGYDYRGRKLSVSYSRQKPEDGDERSGVADAGVQAAVSHAFDVPAADAAPIPASVSNESHGLSSENVEAERLSAAQSAFAAQQVQSSAPADGGERQPFSETTEDGQVKSHFGDGAAY